VHFADFFDLFLEATVVLLKFDLVVSVGQNKNKIKEGKKKNYDFRTVGWAALS
jgi:hypothetical protein